jgi:uncharacterized protein YhhL (DUF1145 family)
MGIFAFFIICIVIGLAVWLINTYIPLPAPIKTVILVAAIIVIVVILLQALGVFGHDIQIPKLR